MHRRDCEAAAVSLAGMLDGSRAQGGERPQSGRDNAEATSGKVAGSADRIVAGQAADRTRPGLTQQSLYAITGFQLITALLSLHCSTRCSDHPLELCSTDNYCMLD